MGINKEINLCDLKKYRGRAEWPWWLVCTAIALTFILGQIKIKRA
jgi:hypothetical protein